MGGGSENTCIRWASSYHRSVRYDTIVEFNIDSKAECGQLNLAHVAVKKKKLKQTNTSAHLVVWPLVCLTFVFDADVINLMDTIYTGRCCLHMFVVQR